MKNDNRGSMLIMTFFIVVALATILTTASFIFIGGKKLGGTQAVAGNIASLQAHYMAEAGIDYALKNLRENWDGYNPSPEEIIPFPSPDPLGSFKLALSRESDTVSERITIESIGTVSGSTKTIKVTVEKGFPAVFRNAIASRQDITIGGNANIEGDIYGNGIISFDGSPTVNGNIVSPNPNGITGASKLQGSFQLYPGGPEQNIPTITPTQQAAWKDQALNGDFHSGDFSITGNKNNIVTLGNTYIEGDLKINSSVTIENNAVVYVKGNVTVTGQAFISGQGIIVAEGTIDITGQSTYVPEEPASVVFVSLSTETSKIAGGGNKGYIAGVIFVPNGELMISGNTEIFGAVVANSIAKGKGETSGIKGSTKIKHNARLRDVVWDPSRPLRFTKWEEKVNTQGSGA